MSSPGPTLTADEPGAGASPTPTEVLEAVRRIVVDVIGEDYVEEVGVDHDTSFHDDLDIESIEFVAIGEALQQRFGDRVDFPGWIAALEVEEIIEMTVGRLVDHIVAAHG